VADRPQSLGTVTTASSTYQPSVADHSDLHSSYGDETALAHGR